MSSLRYIALIAALGISAAGWCQSLEKEITVRHDDEPEYREVSKLNIAPVVSLPAMSVSKLEYSNKAVRVPVPGEISTLEPAAYADSIYTSPYRGYAALGFMPKYNLDLSAGYKIVDNDRTRLNAWLQYNGTAYRGVSPLVDEWQPYVRRNTVTVGAAVHQAAGRESFIDAAADYTFNRFNHPGFYGYSLNESVHRANVSAMWSVRNAGMSYGIGVGYGYFGFAGDDRVATADGYVPYDKNKENRMVLSGNFSGNVSEGSTVGIDVDFSLLDNSASSSFGHDADGNFFVYKEQGFSHSLLTLNPYYRFGIKQFRLDVGARVDLSFNCGKAFHIAPDITATWSPSKFVDVYVKAGGGVRQNTVGSLFDVSIYGNPHMAYRNSDVPLTAEVGVTVGSWRGLHAELSAAYAIADDWLMPVTDGRLSTLFSPVDMRGYKLHASVGYDFRNILSAKVSVELAPQKYDRGYYLWRDRAKQVLEASLRITPVEKLDITVGWEYRGGRVMLDRYPEYGGTESVRWMMNRIKLGAVSNMRAGVLYRITPQWSAFVTGENLFNRHYSLIGGIPGQGITGLVGATYKF